ncbi:UNVERIFIED_CONTAM: hypothetical protein PYX00_011713 [Menopon gallinae]|uniref:EF-hand domain-containing protein n=1 Tax=Menopon gallinae TaxID=328185 RepID=A0AAW2H8E1_9NEOP
MRGSWTRRLKDTAKGRSCPLQAERKASGDLAVLVDAGCAAPRMCLKEELAAYCGRIVLEYLDESSLERSATALEAADLVCVEAERPVCLEEKDETLFVMFHLYAKGHSYFYTLGLCDAMHYELSETAELYKQLVSRYFVDSYAVTRDRMQFSCPVQERRDVSATHPLSRIQLSIRNFFDKRGDGEITVDDVLGDVSALKEMYEGRRTAPAGFSASNALHANIAYVPAKVPCVSVFDALCETEENLRVLKGVLESEDVAEHCYDRLERIAALPVMHRSFLDAVCSRLARSPLDDYRRLRLYARCARMRQMLYEGDKQALESLLDALAFKLGLSAHRPPKSAFSGTQSANLKNTVAASVVREFCAAYEISLL